MAGSRAPFDEIILAFNLMLTQSETSPESWNGLDGRLAPPGPPIMLALDPNENEGGKERRGEAI